MRFEPLEKLSEELTEAVLAPLRAYNREKNPIFFAAREEPPNESRPINLVAYDDAGAVAGGLIGSSQFAWLKIEFVSVRADLRGRGIGRRLMELAEEEARRRECKYVFLDTMSYQAPEFYHKLGYQTAGEIADWDSHGHAKFFLTKALQ